ncbi:MAG: hypothetical protein HYY06_20050 [Deltaproteobacteria bacterium]|nr:hypothetical protein [Deltaproteobacteria bacterium]
MPEICPHCRSSALAVPYYSRAGNQVKRVLDGGAHEGELVCDACGGPRGRESRTGLEPSRDLDAAMRGFAMARSRAGALRAFGIASIGLGALFAAASLATGLGAIAIVGAVVAAAMGGGIGVLSFRSVSRGLQTADARLQSALESALMDAASKSGFELTATEASRVLGVGLKEADQALTAMADGSRVAVEVDDDGIVHYEFRELRLAMGEAAAPRAPAIEPVRVEVAEEEVVTAGGTGAAKERS